MSRRNRALTEHEARSLKPGDELVYRGSDYNWHYATVVAPLRVEDDKVVIETPQGKYATSLDSLTSENWGWYR